MSKKPRPTSAASGKKTRRRGSNSASAAERTRLREHYRQFLVTGDNVRPYNPVLDSPGDPSNTRHWTHGMAEGYFQAGCRCDRCSKAGQEYNAQSTRRRVERRLVEDRLRLRTLLSAWAADRGTAVDATVLDSGVEAVSSVHEIVNVFRATITYDAAAVLAALRAWRYEFDPDTPDEVLASLANDLAQELSR